MIKTTLPDQTLPELSRECSPAAEAKAACVTNLYAQSLDTIRARYPYLDTLELATLMAMRIIAQTLPARLSGVRARTEAAQALLAAMADGSSDDPTAQDCPICVLARTEADQLPCPDGPAVIHLDCDIEFPAQRTMDPSYRRR